MTTPVDPVDPLDHQGLVRMIAQGVYRRHRPVHLSLDDLVAAGQFGLLRACQLFDPGRDYEFSTYAHAWILQSIRREISQRDRTIRVPVYLQEARAYTEKDIRARAKHLGSAARTRRIASLSTPADRDSPGIDPAAPPLDPLRGLVLREVLREVDRLPARERDVLRARLGLDGTAPASLEQLSGALGLSRERVRQIEAAALGRLRRRFGEGEGGEARP